MISFLPLAFPQQKHGAKIGENAASLDLFFIAARRISPNVIIADERTLSVIGVTANIRYDLVILAPKVFKGATEWG